jgi:hypothetical protein
MIKILGNREEQKKHHCSLCGLIKILMNSEDINRFVLTYHFKNKPTDSLHLCMDSPSLEACTPEALSANDSVRPIVDYLEGLNVKVLDYKDETRKSIRERLKEKGIDGVSDVQIEKWTEEVIRNAALGSAIAVRILSAGPTQIRTPELLREKVLAECKQSTSSPVVSSSVHFCFNSLGLGEIHMNGVSYNEEIYVLEDSHHEFAYFSLKRLFRREGWPESIIGT